MARIDVHARQSHAALAFDRSAQAHGVGGGRGAAGARATPADVVNARTGRASQDGRGLASAARRAVRGAWEIARATFNAARKDDLTGEAAKMAFFFFLSLFPLILVVFSLTGIVGGEAAFGRIAEIAQAVVPRYGWQFVSEVIAEIRERNRPGVLSVGILLTIWAASNGIAALTGGLNTMYDVEDARAYWKRRLLALAVLAAGVIVLVLGATLFVPGIGWLRDLQLGGAWRAARWPLAVLLLVGLIWLAYHGLPAREQHHARRETVTGAIVATALWILATYLFRIYIANFSRYGRTYGAVGAVIVLLIWFYISGLAILVGGELAATLEARRRARSAGEDAGKAPELGTEA